MWKTRNPNRCTSSLVGTIMIASVFASVAVGAALGDDMATTAKKCDPDGGKGNGGGNDCPPPPPPPPPPPCESTANDCPPPPPPPCDPNIYDCCHVTASDGSNGSSDFVYDPCDPCTYDPYACCMYAMDGSNGTEDDVYYPCDPCYPYTYNCCYYTMDSAEGAGMAYYDCCAYPMDSDSGSGALYYPVYPCDPCGYYPCDPCGCYYEMPCTSGGAEGSSESSQDGSTAQPLVVCYPCPVETMATDGTTTEGTVESDTIVCPM